MNVQADGWNPGWSNGEALSRVSAQVLYPNRAWLFSTGEAWLNSNLPPGPPLPRPDWVDQVKHTDQDFVSIGCGSLFLNYLAYQLNLRWPDIIGVGAPTTNTLAETATKLNVQNAYQNFYALLAAYFPPSTTMPVSLPPQTTDVNQPPEPTDDPFPLGAIPSPSPVLYIRHNMADNGTSHAPASVPVPTSSSRTILLPSRRPPSRHPPPSAAPRRVIQMFSPAKRIMCICAFGTVARTPPTFSRQFIGRRPLRWSRQVCGISLATRTTPTCPLECGADIKSGDRLARRSNPRPRALLLRGDCGERERSRARPHLVNQLE